MAIDIKRAKFYYEKAYDNYQKVQPLYEEVINFTDQFARMDSSPTDDSNIGSARDTLTAITEPLATLNSFIMSSLLPRGTRFAYLEYAIEKERNENGETQEYEKPSELLVELEDNTQVVFDHIEASNYYTVISRSMRDAAALGTGCFRILERESTLQPYTMKYQPINGLYIHEDALGKPEFIFNNLGEVTVERLLEMYPEAKVPTDGPVWEATVDVVEVIMPSVDEKTGEKLYDYAIMYDDLTKIAYEIQKPFSPLVVFRFDKTTESPYGIGVGVKLLDTFKRLTDYVKLRKRHAELLVDPPGGFVGDAALFQKLSLKKGARNFLGSGLNGDEVRYQSMFPLGDLVEIQEDIDKCEREIKEVCMGSPLGEVESTKNRTAEEIIQRMQLFRDKFANVYESLQEELLQPTFMAPMSILLEREIIAFPVLSGILGEKKANATMIKNFSNFKYINRASEAGNAEMADKILDFKMKMTEVVTPDMQSFVLKDSELIPLIGDLLNVPHKIRYTKKELEEMQQTVDDQRQQQAGMGAVEGQTIDDATSADANMAAAEESMANAEAAMMPEGGM